MSDERLAKAKRKLLSDLAYRTTPNKKPLSYIVLTREQAEAIAEELERADARAIVATTAENL